MRSSSTLSERLVAFVCAKAIFFQSCHAVSQWFKYRGLLPGLVRLCERIAGDAILHAEFACSVLAHRAELPPQGTVCEMVEEAVNIETRFIRGERRLIQTMDRMLIISRCLLPSLIP